MVPMIHLMENTSAINIQVLFWKRIAPDRGRSKLSICELHGLFLRTPIN